jgi:Eukaryotic aspartyl protease
MLRALSTLAFAIVLVLFSAGGDAGKIPSRQVGQSRGLLEYYTALHKYGLTAKIPKSAMGHPQPRANRRDRMRRRHDDSDEIPANITPDGTGYCSPITVGEGDTAQTFNVVLDTGSGDFWVYSDLLLQNEPFLPNVSHTVYNPFNSTTARPSGQINFIQYGAGNETGVVFLDTVTLAGIEAKQQPVEATLKTDDVFNPVNFPCDGIFGLWALGNTTVQPGPNQTVLQDIFFGEGSPDQKIFTALLTRPTEGEGFFTFGSIDQDALQNQTVNFVDVLPPGFLGFSFWNVSANAIFVNGEEIPNSDSTAIVDTGTTLIILNEDVLPAIYEPVGGFFDNNTGAWTFPFNSSIVADLPIITMPVGGHNVTLASEDLAFDTESVPGFAIGGIQGNGVASGGFEIYGDVWLRNVYAVFDLGTGDGTDFRFGFVPREINAVVGPAGTS